MAEDVVRHEDREAILRHVEMVQRASRESIQQKIDLEVVEDRCRQVMALLHKRVTRSFLLMDKMLNLLR